MKKYLLMMLMIIVLIAVIRTVSQASVFEWKIVGGDPYLGNAESAVNKMYRVGYLTFDEKTEALEIFKNHQTTRELIPNGTYLDLMNYGADLINWQVKCNWVNFSVLDAEVAYVGNKKILHFFACNNFGGIKVPLRPVIKKPPCEEKPPNITVNVKIEQSQVQTQQYNIPIAPPGGYSTSAQCWGGASFSVFPVYAPVPSNINISTSSTGGSIGNITTSSAGGQGGDGGHGGNVGNITTTGGAGGSANIAGSGNSHNTNVVAGPQVTNTNNNANSNGTVVNTTQKK